MTHSQDDASGRGVLIPGPSSSDDGGDNSSLRSDATEALRWISVFASIRASDPPDVFRKVARGALVTIAEKAKQAALSSEALPISPSEASAGNLARDEPLQSTSDSSGEVEWVLVPREPTEAMLGAFARAYGTVAPQSTGTMTNRVKRARTKLGFAAMLSALPQPPRPTSCSGGDLASCTDLGSEEPDGSFASESARQSEGGV